VPGFAYQMGILLAAGVNKIEYSLRGKFGYSWALAGFEISNILLLMFVIAIGSENKGKDFVVEA